MAVASYSVKRKPLRPTRARLYMRSADKTDLIAEDGEVLVEGMPTSIRPREVFGNLDFVSGEWQFKTEGKFCIYPACIKFGGVTTKTIVITDDSVQVPPEPFMPVTL